MAIDQVTSGLIKDLAIATGKVADDAITGAKLNMAYCMYLIDCLKPVSSRYLQSGSPRYIGYEIEVLSLLMSPESIMGISEDMIDSMIDNFDDLSDADKDSVVNASIEYLEEHNQIDGLKNSIVTPFSEAYVFLSELMSNPKPLMCSEYVDKASEYIKEGLSKGMDEEGLYFNNPMYNTFWYNYINTIYHFKW